MRDNRQIDVIAIILCGVLLFLFCNTYRCDKANAQDIQIPKISDQPTGDELTEAFKRLYRFMNAIMTQTAGNHIWPAQHEDTIYLDLRFNKITAVSLISMNYHQTFAYIGAIGDSTRGDTAIIGRKQYYSTTVDTVYYLVVGFKKLEK